jgi:glycerophosphoryl diester phosphodiesterase
LPVFGESIFCKSIFGEFMIKRRGFFSQAIGVAVGTTSLANAQPRSKPFDLQGHRGARGLAPENTLPAFARAMDIGVDTLELDIGLTKDDVVVISHDPVLNQDLARDSKGTYVSERVAIRALTYAQLQTYDVGRIKPGSKYAQTFAQQQAMDSTGIPTLDTLFEMVRQRGKNQLRFNIETKLSPLKPEDTASPEVMVRNLLQVIEKNNLATRCTIQSFDWRTLEISQKLAPHIATVYLTIQQGNLNNVGEAMQGRASAWTAGLSAKENESLAALIKRAGGKVWSPFFRDLTQALIVDSQAIGIAVIPWTVNEKADMERLLAWGVDGIISDYPNVLAEFKKTS